MERIVVKNTIDYLLDNALLLKAQHGFIKKRSTRTNLLEYVNDWTLILQNGDSVTVA